VAKQARQVGSKCDQRDISVMTLVNDQCAGHEVKPTAATALAAGHSCHQLKFRKVIWLACVVARNYTNSADSLAWMTSDLTSLPPVQRSDLDQIRCSLPQNSAHVRLR
jgi:hypothetical protein